MASPDPNVGRVLDNRYELIELVGKGAMGRVYLAKHVMLGGAVAVKFLSQTLLSEKMRDRFFAEARTCAQLGHKSIHIVRVTDFGVDASDIPFYVMEYLQGENLSALIHKETLPLPRFLSIMRQTCMGLKAAHEGISVDGKTCPIIHRDIKPSNILVTPDDTIGELAKVLDFGIAKLIQEDASQTQGFMGTLAYSSPEQMEGKELDHRSDIYSLGILMYQCLTGKLPVYTDNHTFGGWYKAHHFQEPQKFEAVLPDLKIPASLAKLIYTCLAKKPEDRPQKMAEIIEELNPLEQRFGEGRHIGHRIGTAPENISVTLGNSAQTGVAGQSSSGRSSSGQESHKGPSPEEICYLQSWPKNKPIKSIVFPRRLKTSAEPLITLWVMLPKQEIEQLKINRLYTQVYRNFLCTLSPHPMAMWLTALHNRHYHGAEEARWLTCYLDLKTPKGQEYLTQLSQQGLYRILCFALEEPQRCAHVLTTKVNPAQCGLMKQWIIHARTWKGQEQPTISKEMLRHELDLIKPKVQENLDSLGDGGSFGISAL
ncbi:MAG: serine/threonine protein kinase [Synechococcales cyanobacterium CRU_2_2]|nr:serine/threonine protein kinase [Synechococcales cyanobacterium CRU_2_2]